MSFYASEKEEEHVVAALTVCQSDKERLTFLRQWFQGTGARHIAANPMRRGAFALVAGMTPRELGQWNIFCAATPTLTAPASDASIPLEPPQDPRIFNRRQADESFRPLANFFDKEM